MDVLTRYKLQRAARWLSVVLGGVACVWTVAVLAGVNSPLIPHVLTGPRLIDGTVVNELIDCANGAVACRYSDNGTTVWHTGGVGIVSNASLTVGTNVTPVSTTTYIAPVFVPTGSTLTGISILNGTVASGNVKVGLANASGVVVASSASTAMSGAMAYQQVPFSATYYAAGPATYYVMLQVDNATARLTMHTVGNFNTKSVTGGTYGTFANFTPSTSFTTAVGPIADTY